MGEEVLQETILGHQCGNYVFLFMAIGLIHASIASHPYMRGTYNKQFGEILFASFDSTMIHCRMLESYCLNLEVAWYTLVEQYFFDKLLECAIG